MDGSALKASLGDAARAARTRRGLTQADVAERLGLATDVYGRLERGHMLPSVPTLRRLCDALSVSADELLGLQRADGQPGPPPRVASEEEKDLRRLVRGARWLSRGELRVLRLLVLAFIKSRRRPRWRCEPNAGRAPGGAPPTRP